jgi:branched-chain amino acid transport system substrate-binding protein
LYPEVSNPEVEIQAAFRQDTDAVATVDHMRPHRAPRRTHAVIRIWPRAKVTATATVLVVAAGLGVGGCTSDETAAGAGVSEVRIGLMTSLSGPDAATGRDAERGAQLAAEIVNDDTPDIAVSLGPGRRLPRLGGASLTVVPTDTTGRPEQAAARAVGLVSAGKVDALVTADTAEVTAAVVQRTERLRLPAVDGRSSAGFLANLGLDFYFRTAPTDRDLGTSAFSLLRSQGASVRRIAIVAASDETATTFVPALRDLATEAGYQIVTAAEFPPGTADPANAARQVRNATPDAVLAVAGTPADAAAAVRAIQTRGGPLPIIGLGNGFLGAGFSAGSGVFRVTTWSAELARRQRLTQAIADQYQRRYNTPMSDVAAGSFTATLTLAAAFDAAASVEADKVRVAILATRVAGARTIMPWDGVQFRENGQNVLASGAVEQYTGSAFQVVFPRELASAPIAWPTVQRTG